MYISRFTNQHIMIPALYSCGISHYSLIITISLMRKSLLISCIICILQVRKLRLIQLHIFATKLVSEVGLTPSRGWCLVNS